MTDTLYEEVNFDGIVGPTHNHGGLAYGNVASMAHKDSISNPKAAALQGLEKMKLLYDLGVRQAVLPPHERPHLPTLRTLGFTGDDTHMISTCLREAPQLFYKLSSAAAMWTANAATMTPSCDTADGLVHFTPANLSANLHRSIEADFTAKLLPRLFPDPHLFMCHSPLPAGPTFADEGAANHVRLCRKESTQGVHLFVYGYCALGTQAPSTHYPARHSLEATQAIIRRHRLSPEQVVIAQQNPAAIDAGVFHNDVIAFGNEAWLICHEAAFLDTEAVYAQLKMKMLLNTHTPLHIYNVTSDRLSLQEAVQSYFFNSQLVTLPDQSMALIAAQECQAQPRAKAIIDELLQDAAFPLKHVFYLNLRESMRNGGGPACLRLRLVLSAPEIQASHPAIYLDTALYHKLKAWIELHYRDRLQAADLADPALLRETQAALDALTQILELGAIYSFQQLPKVRS